MTMAFLYQTRGIVAASKICMLLAMLSLVCMLVGCKHGAKAPLLPERSRVLSSYDAAAGIVLPEQVLMPSGAVYAMPNTAPERFALVQEALSSHTDMTPPVWCLDVLEHDALRGSVHDALRGSVHDALRGSVHNAVRGSVHDAVRGSVHDAVRGSVPSAQASATPSAKPKIVPEPSVKTIGHAPSQDLLARLLLAGDGVEQNSARAFGFALDAARQGHVQAQLLVATLYTLGHGIGHDAEQAFVWLKEAARAEEPEAMAMLADAYRQGLGVAKDEEEAFLWTLKAAKAGVERARLWLGLHYFYGIGNVKDHAEALVLLQPFAHAGDIEAARCLGIIYYQGTAIQQDFAMAAQYFAQGAAAGDRESLLHLGVMLYKGQSVEPKVGQHVDSNVVRSVDQSKDHHMVQSRALFLQGAMAGEPRCMSLLASMLELGEGGPMDTVAAYAWYSMARAHGDAASLPLLRALEQRLSAEEQTKGRALWLGLQRTMQREITK